MPSLIPMAPLPGGRGSQHIPLWTIGLLAVLSNSLCCPAGAADSPASPSVAAPPADDHRMPVDNTRAPWSAIAMVQLGIGSNWIQFCTGALIEPRVVLLGAACLINLRTQRLAPASSLSVLFGYDRGTYRSALRVASYQVGTGFDGHRTDQLGGQRMGSADAHGRTGRLHHSVAAGNCAPSARHAVGAAGLLSGPHARPARRSNLSGQARRFRGRRRRDRPHLHHRAWRHWSAASDTAQRPLGGGWRECLDWP